MVDDSALSSLSSVQPSLPPFETNGVTLSLFDEIIDAWGGLDKLKGLTTTEVNDNFQKPFTAASQSSTVVLLLSKEGDNKNIGPANVFISHAWRYLFLDVVDALRSFFRRKTENSEVLYIWFDLFCNNQHSSTELPFHWWTHTFSTNIKRIGNTVLILSPWDSPVTLRRVWCLYEIYCTVETSSQFDVAMCDAEVSDFLAALTDKEYFGKIQDLIASVDVEKSEAFKDSDRDMIFSAVRTGPGFGTINQIILRRIRQWVIDTADKAKNAINLENEGNKQILSNDLFVNSTENDFDTKRGKLQRSDYYESALTCALGKLLLDQGCYERCVDLLEREAADMTSSLSASPKASGLTEREYSFTDDFLGNKSLLEMQHILAEAYWKAGRYDSSSELMRMVVIQREKLLGEKHPDTLRSKHNLGMLLNSQCNYPASRQLFEECVAMRTVVLGEENKETLQSQLGLAHVCTRVYQNAEAMCLYRRVIEAYTVQLGVSHIETLGVQNNLAYLYRQMGENEEAIKLLRENITARNIKLGEEHPDTLRSISNLAYALNAVGRYDEAESHARMVRAAHSHTIGDRHPYAIYNALYLAHALHGQAARATQDGDANDLNTGSNTNKAKEALEIFEYIFPIGESVLGKNNYQLIEHLAYFRPP